MNDTIYFIDILNLDVLSSFFWNQSDC